MGDHAFKHKYFAKFTWCGVCSEFIWGIATKQGYKCTQCKLVAHEGCRVRAPRPCPKSAPPSSSRSPSSLALTSSPSSRSQSPSSKTLASSHSKKKNDKESSSEEKGDKHIRRSHSKHHKKDSGKASSSASGFDESKLLALFTEYKSKTDEELIDAAGVMGLIKDLELSPEDPVLLVMCYHLKAKVMGEFSREEFVDGFKFMKVDSLEKIVARIPQWREELKDSKRLKEIYDYSFDFYKETPDKKTIDNETAVAVIGLLISDRMHSEQICNFLKEKKAMYKGVNFDQWTSIYDFTLRVDMDFFRYDPDLGEWPLLIDEYVSWARGEVKEEPTPRIKPRLRNEDSDEDL